MNAAFLITFREGLEAAVIVGILLSAVRLFNAHKKSLVIWAGVAGGIIASFLFAWIFNTFTSGFEGTNEKVYEGILMFLAAGIIIHMIFWMKEQAKSIRKKLTKKVELSLSNNDLWSLGGLAMIAVMREGIETVIFMKALIVQSETSNAIFSGILGIIAAVTLAIIVFTGLKKLPIKSFFQFTSLFLIFIAAGLLAHGMVEFQGADWFPTFVKPLYDLHPVLSEKEGFGAILKALFGYDADPSLIAVIVYNVALWGLLWKFWLSENQAKD